MGEGVEVEVEDSVDEAVAVDSVAAEEVVSDSRTTVLQNTLLVSSYWPS